MTNIYIVRHCEGFGNQERTFYGHMNCDVTERGKQQLDCLAERFKDIQFDKIYSSPLLRAIRTADAANRFHGLYLNIDDGLIEINGGVHEGHTWKELNTLYSEQMNYWHNDPQLYSPENGESMREIYDRAFPNVKKIAAENQNKTIVITSHACFIRNLLTRAKNLPIEELKNTGWCDNTSVSLLRFDDNLECEVVFENNVDHLPEELRNLSAKRRAAEKGFV